ncbi:MAG: ATP-binding protein [Clostridia bacterium]|nr:ATP-binding protein [Clostridia bacterium]
MLNVAAMANEYDMSDIEARRLEEKRAAYNSRYLIGTPVFSELREGNYFYIDKTEYVYNMTHSGARYVFLSRPRRFGKSLLVSTLKCYFEGRKDLFKGLAIDKLETEWERYPVLSFDMSGVKTDDVNSLNRYILNQLMTYEKKFNTDPVGFGDVNIRFMNLIQNVHEQTGKKVVVLIDEYDSPILNVVHDEDNFTVIRDLMRNFYSPLKGCGDCLKFVFITGITKFSQMSIFSALNNITNISMEEEFAAVCGITEEELLSQMPEEVDKLAAKQGMTREEALREIKIMYDGYHFCWPSPDIYNPHSLMNALRWKKLESYWFDTGTPTYLINIMNKFSVNAKDIEDIRLCGREAFDAPTEKMTNIIPLFYQSGYFTIKDYSEDDDAYVLDIPNREIRVGLYRSLLPNYIWEYTDSERLIRRISNMLRKDRIDEAFEGLQTFLSTIPYLAGARNEADCQRDLCILLSACGVSPRLEERTAAGRIDLVYASRKKTYIIELKLDRNAEEALRQINDKDYAARYALTGFPVIKIGVNFSSSTRNITDWAIEE